MGRNDTRSLVHLLLFKALPVILISIFSLNTLQAQNQNNKTASNNNEKKDETLLYQLMNRYRLNYYYYYSCHEKTTVTRTYSDNTVKVYDLDMTYFFSINPEDVESDEKQVITISVDSLHFQFSDAEDTTRFNSQSEGIPPINFNPYLKKSILLGKDIDVTLNPYYEFSKAESPQINQVVNWITDEERGIRDTVDLYIWMREMSQHRIKHFLDFSKSSIPYERVGIDSSWTKEIELMADNMRFKGNATYTLTDFDLKKYSIYADSIAFQPVLERVNVYDINRLINLDSGIGFGSFHYILTAQGVVEKAEATLSAVVDLSFRREKFKQIIESKTTWNLFKVSRY